MITVINQQNPVNSLLKLTKYVGRLGGEVDSADCSLDLSLSTESQLEMEKLLPDPWQTIRHMEIRQANSPFSLITLNTFKLSVQRKLAIIYRTYELIAQT